MSEQIVRKHQSPFDVRTVERLRPAAPRVGERGAPCNSCTVRHLTVCAPLEEPELAQMARIAGKMEVGAGDPVIDEGEPASSVYNVTAGTIKVYKLMPDGRRQVTGFLFPGDFLGLANDDGYAYSAEAVTPATLCRFSRSNLESLLERVPKMSRRLLGMANHELAAAQEQMLLLGRKTARERIASFLLMLSARAVGRGEAGAPVAVPMSRADIGDYLGLTTETVSRTVTQFRHAKLIALLPGGRIELLDRPGLEALAEGK